jgi:hypothetical protein
MSNSFAAGVKKFLFNVIFDYTFLLKLPKKENCKRNELFEIHPLAPYFT